MNSDIIPWFVAAAAAGIIIIYKAGKKDAALTLKNIKPAASKTVKTDLDQETLKRKVKTFINKNNMNIKDENEQSFLADSKSISFFNWGFYYIFTFKEQNLTVGIYGKGANPPSLKKQKKILDEIVGSLDL
jgi:hypothetical protein